MKDTFLKMRITEEEYIEFQKVCERKGKSMSVVLRSFVSSYTKGENIILLDVDNDTLNNTIKICKEDRIKFNDLVKKLLNNAFKNKFK